MTNSEPVNFAALRGRWEITPERVEYLGNDDELGPPLGLCLTRVRFENGSVRVRVHGGGNGEHGRIVFGYRSEHERYLLAGLGGHNAAYTIAEMRPGMGWRALARAGSPASIMADRRYQLGVDVSDSRVTLSVDEVQVLEHVSTERLSRGQLGLFCWGPSRVQFSDLDLAARTKDVFVVMQFTSEYDRIFDQAIKQAAEEISLRAYHAGHIYTPGVILKDIVDGIATAAIIVAEITPLNQNVFYELGYAHALNKPVVLLARRGSQLPFDVRGYRVIFYDGDQAGLSDLRANLTQTFQAIVQDDEA